MLTQYERFMGGPMVSARDRDRVTIDSKARITMNRKTFETLGEPEAVALAYDKVNGVIAIERVSAQLPEAFPIYVAKGAWIIFAASFCRHIGLRLDRTMKFDEPKFLPDHTLLLDLRNMSAAGWKIYKPKQA